MRHVRVRAASPKQNRSATGSFGSREVARGWSGKSEVNFHSVQSTRGEAVQIDFPGGHWKSIEPYQRPTGSSAKADTCCTPAFATDGNCRKALQDGAQRAGIVAIDLGLGDVIAPGFSVEAFMETGKAAAELVGRLAHHHWSEHLREQGELDTKIRVSALLGHGAQGD